MPPSEIVESYYFALWFSVIWQGCWTFFYDIHLAWGGSYYSPS